MKRTVKKASRIFLSLVLVCCMLATSALAAQAAVTPQAQKVSNPDSMGGIDGIDTDPEIGRHNSYAWCTEMFSQEDADYLWVGMNRDLGGTLIGAFGGSSISEMIDIPVASEDNMGKIYRQKMADNNAEFEMVYENPAISGYRRMINYKDDLYVLAGMTNRLSGYSYSVVLRFAADFKLGDTPEIVLWDNVPKGTLEYFRSACVFNDKLYIGTFDSKVYVTDGAALQNLEPNNEGTGEKYTGWELAVDLKAEPAFNEVEPGQGYISDAYIWDIIGFDEELYAFVASNSGFNVYEMKMNEDGTVADAVQTVGENESSIYPSGMGINKNAIASPFISTEFDEEYMYVTTFANGPQFLMMLGRGMVQQAFENIFCPAQVYRVDTSGNWEVVVGDSEGDLVAVDKEGNALDVVGNQRAGFFPGDASVKNVSANQYVWWMTEHEGKLYTSTWDTGVFKDYASVIMLNTFAQAFGMENIQELSENTTELTEQLQLQIEELMAKIAEENENFDVDALTADLAQAIEEFNEYVKTVGAENITEDDIKAFAQGILGIITVHAPQMPKEEIVAIVSTITELYNTVKPYGPQASEALSVTVAAAFASGLYFMDKSNPAGFDLFVSENGTDFEPVTVDGFGDPYNYGGRVLLSTEYGLYVATANPFFGGQIWRADALEESIFMNAPASVYLKRGQTTSFTVKANTLDEIEKMTAELSETELVTVEIEQIGEASEVWDLVSEISLEPSVFTYGGFKYVEDHWAYTMPTYMFKVTLTAQELGQEDVTVTTNINGMTAEKTIAVTVEETIGLYGDVNVDGEVDIADALIISKDIAKLITIEGDALILGDVNFNGEVDLEDLLMVQKYIAKLNVKVVGTPA